MPIKQITLSPPAEKHAGDTFTRHGRYLEQWRAGALIQSWDLLQAESETVEVATVGSTTIETLYLEIGMPGQNVSMTQVRENANTGAVIVNFSSGTELEIVDWAAVGEIADNLDATTDLAEKILLGKAYRASPDGSNKTTQIGASVSVNLLAETPVVYTPVV